MSTTKKRPADGDPDTRTWEGWSLFGPRDKNSKHACKLCAQQITYSNTTSSFKKHLKTKHAAHWEEFQARKDDITSTQAAVPPSAPTLLDLLDPVKIELRTAATKSLVKSLEKDIVRFIVGDIRPFYAVEGIPFLTPSFFSFSFLSFSFLFLPFRNLKSFARRRILPAGDSRTPEAPKAIVRSQLRERAGYARFFRRRKLCTHPPLLLVFLNSFLSIGA